jgi:hypothetical protein
MIGTVVYTTLAGPYRQNWDTHRQHSQSYTGREYVRDGPQTPPCHEARALQRGGMV